MKKSIQDSFDAFHKKNPEVFTKLMELARKMQAKGRKRIGIAMLFEVLRWNYYMETTDENSRFKVSNNYRSRYVRLMIQTDSTLKDLFETREMKTI